MRFSTVNHKLRDLCRVYEEGHVTESGRVGHGPVQEADLFLPLRYRQRRHIRYRSESINRLPPSLLTSKGHYRIRNGTVPWRTLGAWRHLPKAR